MSLDGKFRQHGHGQTRERMRVTEDREILGTRFNLLRYSRRKPTNLWASNHISTCDLGLCCCNIALGSFHPRFPAAFGISIEGLEHFLETHADFINGDSTISDVCHTLIKPETLPKGWRSNVDLVDEEKRWCQPE